MQMMLATTTHLRTQPPAPNRSFFHSNAIGRNNYFFTHMTSHVRQIDFCICTNINTLRPRQDGRYFTDDVSKCIFLNENVWISLKVPLKFVPKGPINNIPALVQIMAWRRPGDKPLSEPMLVFVPTHICVTRPQWVNYARFQIHLICFIDAVMFICHYKTRASIH